MTTMPRLLFVCNQAAYFMRHWIARADAAARAGFLVTVALPDQPTDPLPAGIGVTRYYLDRSSLDPWTNARALASLWRVLRSVRPDLVHAATVKPNVLTSLATLCPTRIPCVLSIPGLGTAFTSHGHRYSMARAVARAAYRLSRRRSDAVLAVDNLDDAQALARLGVGSPDGVVLTPGAGVDPGEFEVGPEPATPPVQVVLPARMLWSKGVGVFVEAAERLHRDRVPVRMALVGDTDDSSRDSVPRATLEAWHAQGTVSWLGFRRDMPEVLRLANIVCLPTLYREGLPRALTEAALAERSLVATDVPGCREIVDHDVTGLRVAPGDPDGLAAAIARLARDAGLRKRLAREARQRALARFTNDVVIDRTFRIYERLLRLSPGSLHAVVNGPRAA